MTARDSAAAIVQDLFIDSLLFLALLPPRPLALVDIGAGAGIPGLPLRLADPAIAVTLVEARRKRISFLLAAQRELDLGNVAVKEGRAEALLEPVEGAAAQGVESGGEAGVTKTAAPGGEERGVGHRAVYLPPY